MRRILRRRGAGRSAFRDLRLPQELRLAGIDTVEGAKQFLRDRYIAEFHEKFTEIAKEKGTAFRRTSRADLDWIFTARNERTVAKDNTVALGERIRQIEKTKFRNSLAGCVVTIHEHLDGRFSIRYGPHVMGRYGCDGTAVGNAERRGKAGPVEAVQNHRQVSHRSHSSLEISQKARDFHFPTAPTVLPLNNPKKACGGLPGRPCPSLNGSVIS